MTFRRSVFVTLALIRRNAALALTRGGQSVMPVVFFMIVASLFAVGAGGLPVLVRDAAPAVLWTGALLAALLPLESLYHHDARTGHDRLLLIQRVSAGHIVFAKIVTHGLAFGLPLVLAAMPLALMLFLPFSALPFTMAALATGMLYLALLGAFGATLTLGARNPGLLAAILVLPLSLPVLVTGVTTIQAAAAGMDAWPPFLLMVALTLGMAPFAWFLAARMLDTYLRA